MTSRVPYSPISIDQSAVVYDHGPDSFPRSDVQSGQTTRVDLDDSAAYPGTTRGVWVHVPAAAPPEQVLPCMVFQDGGGFLDPEGSLRAGIVLDNLVAAGPIPPMYDVRLALGDGGHDPNHAGVLLPDALRWIWRD